MDDFWDIRTHEKHEEQSIRARIEALDRQIAVARRATALRGNAGFDDFLRAVTALRTSVVRDLAASTASNDWLRVLQGKAQALGDVLALLHQSDQAIEQLAADRSILQNHLESVLLRRPVALEQEVSS